MNRSLIDLLKDYGELPEYLGEPKPGVHSRSLFGDYPISVAAVRGNVDDLQILLEAGADVNQRGEHGLTPLHYAVLHGHLEIVLHLLKAGAARELRNDDNDTAFDVAKNLENAIIIAALSDHN